jgi:hypothetical protein
MNRCIKNKENDATKVKYIIGLKIIVTIFTLQ